MSLTRHERVKSIFFAVSECSPDEREKLLERACQGDIDLRREVESLLDHAETPHVDFDDAARQLRGLIASAATGRTTPLERLGEYQIHGVLGEGGMGVVYLAEQDKPRRTVALKVIRAGMVTPGLLKRFEHETQVLGRLQHPGIARIYDAGAGDAGAGLQPFFAMEYVRGRPLIDHAEAHKLGTRDRLRLMVKVCQAVQYAHQNGVIHRDLKPTNILVDEHDQPKILDFGVARSTDSDTRTTTLHTDVGQLIGTVPYMSPEQVGGDSTKIDARSDVYALGVILYELLAGRLPYDLRGKSIPEAVRIIGQQDHTPLSSMNRVFRGDLDTIVAKALEKEAQRRYATAAELALDLQRYLDDQPIIARPPSALYQFGKFAKRNRAVVAAGAVIATSLTSATIVSVMYALRESQARADAVNAQDEEKRQRAIADERREEADRRAEEAVWQAHLAHIAAADAALAAHDIPTARRRLLQIPEANRNTWEWRHLFSKLDDSVYMLSPGVSAIYACEYLPDGNSIVVSCWDKNVRILDAQTLHTRVVLGGHTSRVFGLDVAPSGRIVVSGAEDNTVRIWDLELLAPRLVIEGFDDAVGVVTISPDERYVACGTKKGHVHILDLQTGERLREWVAHEHDIYAIVFADAERIFTGSGDSRIREWRISDGSMLRSLEAHGARVRDLAMSPDGTRLLSVSEDGLARVWDSRSLSMLLVLRGHIGVVRCGTFSPDGKLILTGAGDTTLRLWDATTGEALAVLTGHPTDVFDAAFHPNGEQFVSTCVDGNVRLWDRALADGPNSLRGHTRSIVAGGFSWDGSRYYTASMDGTVGAWNLETGLRECSKPGSSLLQQHLAVSPDGLTIATTDGATSVVLRDASTLEPRATATLHTATISEISFASDGVTLVTASYDGAVHLFDTSTMSIIKTFADETDKAMWAQMTPDRSAVIIGRLSRTIKRIDVATGEAQWTFRAGVKALSTLALSDDGALLAVGAGGGEIMLLDALTGEHVGRRMDNPSAIVRLAFSPDRKRLAAGTSDGSVRVWDVDRNDEVIALRDHIENVTALEWSPDGTRLASASHDRRVRLWEITKASERIEARRRRMQPPQEQIPAASSPSN